MKRLAPYSLLASFALLSPVALTGCGQNLPEPAGPEMSVDEAMEKSMPQFKQFMSGDEPQDAAQMFTPGGGAEQYPGAGKK